MKSPLRILAAGSAITALTFSLAACSSAESNVEIKPVDKASASTEEVVELTPSTVGPNILEAEVVTTDAGSYKKLVFDPSTDMSQFTIDMTAAGDNASAIDTFIKTATAYTVDYYYDSDFLDNGKIPNKESIIGNPIFNQDVAWTENDRMARAFFKTRLQTDGAPRYSALNIQPYNVMLTESDSEESKSLFVLFLEDYAAIPNVTPEQLQDFMTEIQREPGDFVINTELPAWVTAGKNSILQMEGISYVTARESAPDKISGVSDRGITYYITEEGGDETQRIVLMHPKEGPFSDGIAQ